MAEENLPTQEEDSEELPSTEPLEPLSKSDAIIGVFAEPGNTYDTIANSPRQNYWLLPVIMFIVINLIATFLFMRNAELVGKVKDKTIQKMSEKFDEKIKEGKNTQEDKDKAIGTTEKFMDPKNALFLAIGYGGSVVKPFVVLFILALVYLVILKIMNANFDFTNILNVIGLAMLIDAIGVLATSILSLVMGDMVNVSLGLVLKEESVGEKINSLFTKLDLFSIWFYIVVTIGLSKAARIDMMKSALAVFGVWILWVIATAIIF